MEIIGRIIGIILAFVLSTLVGYFFWYIARGHRLKERREQLKQEKQNKTDAPVQKKKKSDAESINEVMGYDFIPMRSINRKEDSHQDEEKESVKVQPTQKQPKAVSQKENTEERRSWNNSHSEDFEEQTGKLGISSNNHEETEQEQEPETETYSGYGESWPETTEEEIDSYEEQMRKWAEDESTVVENDETAEESENVNKTEDSFDEFEDIWDGAIEKRNEDKEEIRKKSLSIGKIGKESSALSDEEIDELHMNE